MRDGNFEQLIILAVVLGAWLLNFVLDQLRNRGRTAPPQDRDENLAVEEEEIDLAEAIRPQVVVPPPMPDSRGVSPEPSPRQAPAPRAVSSVRPRVPPPRSPAGSPESRRLRRRIDSLEARRGVVLMTILGPCRGVEPPAGNAFDPLARSPVATARMRRGRTRYAAPRMSGAPLAEVRFRDPLDPLGMLG